MNLTGKNVFVVDIEGNGFLEVITKLWVLSASYLKDDGSWAIISVTGEDRIRNLIGNKDNVIVGHNFIGFDKPALQKLGYEFNAQVIDTLGLSWYLYADRRLHGLESWGEDFGVPKVKVEDHVWAGLPDYKLTVIHNYYGPDPIQNEIFNTLPEEDQEYLSHLWADELAAFDALMIHRCEEDVNINLNLWLKQLGLLMELYENDEAAIIKVIHLCNFLLEVIVVQRNNRIKLDVPLVRKNLGILNAIKEDKSEKLSQIMPKVAKKTKRVKPKNPFKKPTTLPNKMFDKKGNLTAGGKKWMALLEAQELPEDHTEPIIEMSESGKRWFDLLNRAGLPEDYDEPIQEITSYDEPNPGAPAQVKAWLDTFGWDPIIFTDGANGPVPQLRDEDKNLCKSVLELIHVEPGIEHLEGLSVASHRAAVLQGFLDTMDEYGYVTAGVSKFTRTMRYAHKKPIVNLPQNTATHGELIRICLVAPEGAEWVNADLDSLEDRCKQIQVAPWASHEYLNKPPGYDPHLEVAVAAGLMSQTECDFFKWYKTKPKEQLFPEGVGYAEAVVEWNSKCNIEMEDTFWSTEFSRLGDIRSKGKTSNYAIIYGVGAFKLSKTIGTTKKEAQAIIDAYWRIHKPVKDYEATLITKTVDDRTWVWNDFTKLWLNYKGDHNKFSACTQNFGAIVHARMMFFLIKSGVPIIMNIHDEESWYNPVGKRAECEATVAHCIDLVNESFGFDIKFGSSPEFAPSYGLVH